MNPLVEYLSLRAALLLFIACGLFLYIDLRRPK